MTTEKLEVDKSEKTTNQEKDSMEMMKMNKKEQKEVMEQETAYSETYSCTKAKYGWKEAPHNNSDQDQSILKQPRQTEDEHGEK